MLSQENALETSSGKWRPFCLGPNVLITHICIDEKAPQWLNQEYVAYFNCEAFYAQYKRWIDWLMVHYLQTVHAEKWNFVSGVYPYQMISSAVVYPRPAFILCPVAIHSNLIQGFEVKKCTADTKDTRCRSDNWRLRITQTHQMGTVEIDKISKFDFFNHKMDNNAHKISLYW